MVNAESGAHGGVVSALNSCKLRFSVTWEGTMRIGTKSLFVGLSVIAAVAVSATPSEAAKRKAAKCDISRACTGACTAGSCEIRRCDADGKSYAYFPPMTCGLGACPPKC